jgi:hypothetical protein
MAKAKRKNLSKRQRFEVFKRDAFTCQYCGRKPPEVILEADHMIPVAAGGKDHESNMVTACKDCNAGKSDKSLDQVPASLSLQMQERRDRMAQLKQYNGFLLEEREYDNRQVQLIGMEWCNRINPVSEQDQFTFTSARATSVRRFLKHLPAVEVMDALEIAFARIPFEGRCDNKRDDDRFRYFCGICWKIIRDEE